jgi:hypothetical protein
MDVDHGRFEAFMHKQILRGVDVICYKNNASGAYHHNSGSKVGLFVLAASINFLW